MSPLRRPPPAQHLVCSRRGLIHLCSRSSSLLRGLFTVGEGVNPMEGGGHGLWGPLSPPCPPELRPQEAEPPPSGLVPPQGGCANGHGGVTAGCSPEQGSGGHQPCPPNPFALEHGVQPTFWGSVWGSISCFSCSSDVFGTGGFHPSRWHSPAAWAPSRWSMPWDLSPRVPHTHPGARTSPPAPPYSPPSIPATSIPAAGLTSHLPSCPRSGPIPLTPPTPTGPYNP